MGTNQQMRSITATERVGPAKLPMDMEAGRLTFAEGAQLFGLGVGALGVAALGSLLAWAAFPGAVWDWSGWRFVFVSFGLGVGALGVGMSSITAWFAFIEWSSYVRRKEDYHQLWVEAHQTTGGVEVERTITGWELTSTRPLHALGVALAVHERVSRGEATAFSTRQLEGPVWLGGVRLGDLTPAAAEETSRLLADVGLVRGRASRTAGKWSAESENQVIKAIVAGWARRGNQEGDYAD